jgi:hypothetical protein
VSARAFVAVTLLACGNSTTPPKTTTTAPSAPSAVVTASATAVASAPATASASASAAPSSSVAVRVPPLGSGPCTGADVDLENTLAAAACQTTREKMPDDVLSRVHVNVGHGGPIAPGGHTTFIVMLENKSDAWLPLTFKWPVGHALVAAIKDAAGKDMRDPGAPPCTDPKAAAALRLTMQANDMFAGSTMGAYGLSGPAPRPQIVIAPKGQAHVHLAWMAMGRKWGPAKGTGKDCTADVADVPLPPGDYHVTVELPELEGKKLPEKTFPFSVR